MEMVDRIDERIDDILSNYPSTTIHLCDDLNFRHDQWLAHSNIIEEDDKYSHDFAIAYELNQANSCSRYCWELY